VEIAILIRDTKEWINGKLFMMMIHMMMKNENAPVGNPTGVLSYS